MARTHTTRTATHGCTQVAELRLLTEEDYKEMNLSIGIRRKLLECLSASKDATLAPQAPTAKEAYTTSGGGVACSGSAFGFMDAGASASAPASTVGVGGPIGMTPADQAELQALQRDVALTAALNAAATSGSAALAQRPAACSGYNYEIQPGPAPPTLTGGTGSAEPLVAEKAGGKKVRANGKKSELAVPFMANERSGPM